MVQHLDLIKLGLTEGEAKVYLALLDMGSSTVGPIVKSSRVAYSNIYDILHRLMEKGLVSYVIKSRTKHFQAADPSAILDYLDKKEAEIIDRKNAFESILHSLKRLQKEKPKQEGEIFLGMKGLRTAYEKLFGDFTERSCFFYIHKEGYATEADLFYLNIKDLLKKAKIRGICNEEARKSEVNIKLTFMKYRYVDFPIPGNMEACGDRLLLVSWQHPVTAFLISSQSLADNFRKYFEAVWKVAKV